MQEAPPSHDILVFMTGQEEIEALARTCRDIAKHLPESCGPMLVIALYASLPPAQQLRVFQPAPKVNQHSISTRAHSSMYCLKFKTICLRCVCVMAAEPAGFHFGAHVIRLEHSQCHSECSSKFQCLDYISQT